MAQELPHPLASEQLRRALELHEGLCQSLSALALYSRMLADDLHASAPSHAGQAERLVAIVRATNQVTRQLRQTLQISSLPEK
jgi:ATP-dependent exoDNAse (exonuclease V) alpha subunit